MSIKGTGCEDVNWTDVVHWCARASDLHKKMEIIRRAAQKFTSHEGLLLGSKPSLELFVLKSIILNGNIIMDDEFAIIWEDVIVNYFSLLENKRISPQTSVRIARSLQKVVYQEPGVSSAVIFSVKIEKPDEVSF
jgi:hypothetical protein